MVVSCLVVEGHTSQKCVTVGFRVINLCNVCVCMSVKLSKVLQLCLECNVVVTAAAGSSLLFRGSVPMLVATLGGAPSNCTCVPNSS